MNPAQLRKVTDARALTRRDSEEFEAWLRTRGMTWQGIDSGAYEGVTLEVALTMWVICDPVRWVETFLFEPRTGEPYRLFDYQRESMRAWRQDTVHQCGAEVGKTREIIGLLLWGCCTSMGGEVDRPWFLVGAPLQSHLDEIIMAVEDQVGVTSDGGARGTPESGEPLHRIRQGLTQREHRRLKVSPQGRGHVERRFHRTIEDVGVFAGLVCHRFKGKENVARRLDDLVVDCRHAGQRPGQLLEVCLRDVR